jgi:hypothetical protein
MKLTPLLADLRTLEHCLAAAYRETAEVHSDEHDVHYQSLTFAKQCDRHVERLGDARGVSGKAASLTGELVDDLRTIFLLTEEVSITWVIAGQAAQALRDAHLLNTVRECHEETELQVKWLTTRIKDAAPQALVVGRAPGSC